MLAQRLKQALSIRNMKPIELAEKTSIPKSAISQYMSGYAKPKNDRIYLICKALDINEAWLLGLGDNMERKTFSTDNASLVKEIRNDEELTESLKIYFSLSQSKKEFICNMIKQVAELE